jgi:hypothetical protein
LSVSTSGCWRWRAPVLSLTYHPSRRTQGGGAGCFAASLAYSFTAVGSWCWSRNPNVFVVRRLWLYSRPSGTSGRRASTHLVGVHPQPLVPQADIRQPFRGGRGLRRGVPGRRRRRSGRRREKRGGGGGGGGAPLRGRVGRPRYESHCDGSARALDDRRCLLVRLAVHRTALHGDQHHPHEQLCLVGSAGCKRALRSTSATGRCS